MAATLYPCRLSMVSAFLLAICLLFQPCHGAGSCKSEDMADQRNPFNTVQRCLITRDKDFNLIPSNTTALWVEFPAENSVNFATHFPTLSKLTFLKIDITFLTIEPKTFDDNFQLPKLKSLHIVRDSNKVDSNIIAITLEDDLFLGLYRLENLYLDNLGIQDLAENALRGLDSLQVLDLTLNYISKIKPFMFIHCTNLTNLQLRDNFISSIHDSSFAGLNLLGSLDISMNKIQKIPAGPFVNLKNLELFFATSNDLQTIELGAFEGLGKLHYISLARNNLTEIDPLAFQGLTGVETFILDHNKIKLQMGQFAQASNILHLYMAHNDIKSITSDYFEGLLSITELILEANSITLLETQVFYPMPTLMTLDIRDNKINHVEENALQGLTSLQTLNIQENRIKTLPQGSFDDLTNLKTLSMDQNPWVCSCETEWLINWLRERYNKLEPAAQFYFIICSDTDPIPTQTFHTLITDEDFYQELNCGDVFVPSSTNNKKPTKPGTNGKTTDKNGQQMTEDPAEDASRTPSTTEKTVIKIHNKQMSKTQKVIIIVCSVLAVLALVAIIVIHIYCRQKKHRSWVPPDQKKLDQQKSVLPQSKKVTTSNSDPEAGYWSKICDDLPELYPTNTSQSEILKAAYKSPIQEYQNNHYHRGNPESHQHVYQNHSYISDSLEFIHKFTDINHQKRGDLSDTEHASNLQQQQKEDRSKKQKAMRRMNLNPQTVVQIERKPDHQSPSSTVQQKTIRRLNGGNHRYSGENNQVDLNNTPAVLTYNTNKSHRPSHTLMNHSHKKPSRDGSLELKNMKH